MAARRELTMGEWSELKTRYSHGVLQQRVDSTLIFNQPFHPSFIDQFTE